MIGDITEFLSPSGQQAHIHCPVTTVTSELMCISTKLFILGADVFSYKTSL